MKLNVKAGLEKMRDKLLESGYKPERDQFGSSGNHALAVCTNGLAALEKGDELHAAYALGFVQRAMIGMGVYDAKELVEVSNSILK